MEKGGAADNSPTLEFWFDFASPYSYLATSRIEALVSANHIWIQWRAFLLGPIFKRRASNPTTDPHSRES
jgi:2-hydroxychromene-2-carboxylate isomerase